MKWTQVKNLIEFIEMWTTKQRTNMYECNKGEKVLWKVIYHTYGKLEENVYVNEKCVWVGKSFDESPLVCVCVLYKFLIYFH